MNAAAIITPEKTKALAAILDGLVDAIGAAGPLGCPAGVLYAFLMAY